MPKHVLITGCAGFIGFHLARKLLEKTKYKIIGIDNLNSYYDVKLKKKRLYELKKFKNFFFKKINISNFISLKNIFNKYNFEFAINLAAQAGVRYSLVTRKPYFESNIKGFFNLLELIKNSNVKRFVFASTSSVYGDNNNFPLKETYSTDEPKSFYAATKKCNEIMAYAYAKMSKVKFIGLRFFTVYGPYGRPDMALFKFSKLIKENKSIEVFNRGNHARDFTYIDDITDGIVKAIFSKKIKNNFEIFNLCKGKKENLNYLISLVEKNFKKKLKKNFLPMQFGDIKNTFGSILKSKKILKYNPKIKLDQGVKEFLKWFKKYE